MWNRDKRVKGLESSVTLELSVRMMGSSDMLACDCNDVDTFTRSVNMAMKITPSLSEPPLTVRARVAS